ncbi:hypothetical protein PtA15_7A143 [Puccinia triticina]|uniref:SAM domain-containing protein n=1 Tax=Puccinia triticina TaxID=208348 RepID=A0ABY7CR17_9BASI|nr:uncharacterized protein PtA15_7A143 [Puccinia triticina]WAQ86417.1 hypothetical protein PtA15_7A143 [Puccinia triticina]
MASMELYDPSLPPYFSPMINLAANGSPSPVPQNPPMFTSEGFRVLGLGPPVLFECAVNFTIYCSEKTKRNATNWVAVRPKSELSVTFNTRNNVSLSGFQKMIADKCNEQYNCLGQIIHEGTIGSPSTITWNVYILSNKKFPKKNSHHLFDELSFNQWITEINTSKQTKGGVVILMDNPRNAAVHARKEDLVAKTIKRMEARQLGPVGPSRRSQRALGDSDVGESSDVEFKDLDIYTNQIYAKYSMNVEYDRFHPAYPDPTNADRYIPLTSGNIDIWAKAMCSRVAGVSLTSPPSSLKYETRKGKAKSKLSKETSAGASNNSFVEFANWFANHQARNVRASPPSSVHGATPDQLVNYLVFVSIAPHKREELLTTLLEHDIDNYQMFKSLSVEELRSIGFNVGVISKLRSNVNKFRNHLAQNP